MVFAFCTNEANGQPWDLALFRKSHPAREDFARTSQWTSPGQFVLFRNLYQRTHQPLQNWLCFVERSRNRDCGEWSPSAPPAHSFCFVILHERTHAATPIGLCFVKQGLSKLQKNRTYTWVVKETPVIHGHGRQPGIEATAESTPW